MPDPLDYTARLKAKGLDSTGVTEEHARRMASGLGRRTVLIVEVVHDELVTKADGQQQVKLAVTQVEPVPDEHEDTVREFMRSLYRLRPEHAGQDVLNGVDPGPAIADAARAIHSAAAAGEEPDDEEWDGDTDGPLPGDAPEDPPADDGRVVKFSGRA